MTITTSRRRLNVDEITECFYVPGSVQLIDVIHPDDGLSLYGKADHSAIQAEYPGAVRMSFAEACRQIDAAQVAHYVKPVSEIDDATYWERLEVLPPHDWRTVDGVESFKMSERLCGSITGIYAQYRGRYFTMTDDCRLPASEIAARVRAFVQE